MSDKPMTEAEFEELIKQFNEDTLNYNEDIPVLFAEIGRLKGDLRAYRELAKVTQEMLNNFSAGSWVISSELFTRASKALKEVEG